MSGFSIYLKDRQRLYSFDSEDQAVAWLERTPHDLKNVIFFSGAPLEGVLLAKEEVKLEFHCGGCGSGLRVYRHPKDTHLHVQCPACGGVNVITAPDVSSSDEPRDED